MRDRNRWIAAMVGSLTLVGAGLALAQDWPQWRGANRDGKVTGFAAPDKWPAELTQTWKAAVGAGDATPALVGDRLYVTARQGDEEVTLCLNASDGKEVWSDKYTAKAVTGAASRHPGPRSSPAVAEGKVVTLGVDGVLSCLDAATGKLVWRKDPFPGVVPRFFTSMSPMIADGTAIAYLGGPGNGALMAFDLATGDVKWQWTAEGPDYGSPVLMTAAGTKQIVTLTDKSLVGVGLADGKLLWQVPTPPAGRMAYNAGTPVLDGQTVIYSAGGVGFKAVSIEKQGETFAAKEAWSNPDNVAIQFSSPVLKDGFLYGLSNRGNLFCINAKSGQTAWTDTTARGGGFGSVVDAGAVLMALPKGPDLLVFKPSDKGYEELAKVKVSDPENYAYPILAGKRIIVRDVNSVTLFTLP